MEIARRLIAMSDVVAEGFSPGVLQRLGLGYDVLRSLRPDIIYVQQSGMGGIGTYGRFRTIGRSRPPSPAPRKCRACPNGDARGLGLFLPRLDRRLQLRQRHHGRAVSSRPHRAGAVDRQLPCESGIFLSQCRSSTGRRTGAASGASATARLQARRAARRLSLRREDRWIAIAAFDEAEWQALARVAGRADWLSDPRFATLESRLLHQDALDAAVTEWTQGQDAHACMAGLQAAGVPAGVCQTAEDRYDRDPQLAALSWLTEVNGTRIGRWPVAEIPTRLSATPPYAGGIIDRGAPGYGEDNARLLGELLGYSSAQVAALAEEGVI